MPALRELQLNFVEAVLSGKFDALAECIRAPGSTPERRLGIYRNNTISNLRGALREVYPIIEQLVGAEFFSQAAKEFIAAHPSTSGDLNDYGDGFADFLTGFPPAAELPYLPDVARLEWALERAYYAPDQAPLELQRLGEVSPDRYGDLRLKLHPAAALIQSDYPLGAIWEFHQPGYEGDGFIDLNAGGAMMLVTRRDMRTMMEPLDQAEFVFLKLLQENQSFVVAVTEALERDPAFPLQERLAARVMQGDIVDFCLGTSE
jgi:hypothetical protein